MGSFFLTLSIIFLPIYGHKKRAKAHLLVGNVTEVGRKNERKWSKSAHLPTFCPFIFA